MLDTSTSGADTVPAGLSEPQRAGFWRRLLALVIDAVMVGIVFGLVFQVLAIPAYSLSHGRIQYSEWARWTECTSVPIPAEDITEDFHPNFATECVSTFFGYPVAHTLTVGEERRTANSHSSFAWHYGLDADGRRIPVQSFFWLQFAMVALVRRWFDAGRGSPGRRVLGLHLRAADLKGGPPPRPALTRRYLWFAAPVAPMAVFAGLQIAVPALTGWTAILVAAVLYIVPYGVAAVAVLRGRDAWYDRLARTAVVWEPVAPSPEGAPAARSPP